MISNTLPLEPPMDDRDLADLNEGIQLFNQEKFWYAHEAWEAVWRRKPGCCDGFFKGIIQAAAAFHKMKEGSLKGMRIHLARSVTKLKPYAAGFFGLDIASFLRGLEQCQNEIETGNFPVQRLPKIIRLDRR